VSFTCQQCGQRQSFKQPHPTITGRQLCTYCHDRLTGTIVGLAASSERGAGLGGTLATGVMTGHFYANLRRRFRERFRRGAPGTADHGAPDTVHTVDIDIDIDTVDIDTVDTDHLHRDAVVPPTSH
jgi:hypothetical protein